LRYDPVLARLLTATEQPEQACARRADINAALKLARPQGATLFEQRAALDDFELRGEPARAALIDAASRIPANNAWPELNGPRRAFLNIRHESETGPLAMR
jgi:hypothetical protein